MSTNKTITAVIAAIALILISIFIYQSCSCYANHKILVKSYECDNKKILLILNTDETNDVENHNQLAIPDDAKILPSKPIRNINKYYFINACETGSGKLKNISINEAPNSSYINDDTPPVIYSKLSASRQHKLCDVLHSSNYHTKRHIIYQERVFNKVSGDTLSSNINSSSQNVYFLYKIDNLNTEYVFLNSTLHRQYQTLNRDSLFIEKDTIFFYTESNFRGYEVSEIDTIHTH